MKACAHLVRCWVLSFVLTSLSQAALPEITRLSASGSNLVVNAQIPAGLRKVVLESKAHSDPGAWTPRAVARLDGAGQSIEFQLPIRRNLELIRIRAEDSDPIHSSFFSGTSEFPDQVSQSGVSPLYLNGTTSGPREDTAVPGTGSTSGGAVRAVAESDIWRIHGDRLFFFNSLRGLQVVDISSIDSPRLKGTLPMPGAGEEMYVLENGVVVLLAQSGCYWGAEGAQIILASTQGDTPAIMHRLPLQGYISHSRMVGTALYVATQTYRMLLKDGQTSYQSGVALHAFDLSDPSKPIAQETLWFPGTAHAVSATDSLFFVVTQADGDWSRSVIHTVDITSPNGMMNRYVTIPAAGVIRDKFKLDYQGTRFTCISEEQTQGRRTRLETFFLAHPLSAGPISLRKLGEVRLAERESLFATRFDGDKAYIVTFERIDPLFIVDLSDPTRPRVTGEVEVPGWSTYIHPLGDRLVSVGTETNRVAVSLFDVRDPSRPGLLSRVVLGNSYSWSESSYNEKAVTVLASAGLILVPYSGDTTNGYASKLQLIDLDLRRDRLTARGTIERPMQPRRSTLRQDRVLAITAREVVSVDASNRDLPVVKGSAELGWPVDRVVLAGEHLVEISSQGSWWAGDRKSQLHIATTSEPDRPLGTLELGSDAVAGTVYRDGIVYLAQTPNRGFLVAPRESGTGGSTGADVDPATTDVWIRAVDVSDPASPRIRSEVRVKVSELWLNGDGWQGLWVRPGLLTWYVPGGGGWYWGGPIPLAGRAMTDAMVAWPPWPPHSSSPWLIACSAEEGVLRHQSTLQVKRAPENASAGSSSRAFAAEGLVFLSHLESELLPDPVVKEPRQDTAPGGGWWWTPQRWAHRHWLDVVDFELPSRPELREPTRIPGALQGVAVKGAILFTLAHAYHSTSGEFTGSELAALAYDGVRAHLIDQKRFESTWLNSVVTSEDTVYLARAAADPALPTQKAWVEGWRLGGDGRFDEGGRVETRGLAHQLALRGSLLVAAEGGARVLLLDASHPGRLVPVGSSTQGGCFWGDIERGDGAFGRGFWVPLGEYGVLPATVQ
ncbi:MAG: hypothetical protein FJ405_04800 [Verrucomicrobia bacterium]|nr:hypothetical protein [Verrucomicrobiota bacterium]